MRWSLYRSGLSTQSYRRGVTRKTTSVEEVLELLALGHESKIHSWGGRRKIPCGWSREGRRLLALGPASPSSEQLLQDKAGMSD